MREKEVKELIGEGNWEEFDRWMTGQTVGMETDGQINYYKSDVMTFLDKLKTGYDVGLR